MPRFAELLYSRTKLILHAPYTVQVSGAMRQGRKKKRELLEVKKLTLSVNLLNKSFSFLETLCHCTEEAIPYSHGSMLRNIYCLVVVLREMFLQKFHHGLNFSSHSVGTPGSGAAARNADQGERRSPHVAGNKDVTTKIPEDKNVEQDRENTSDRSACNGDSNFCLVDKVVNPITPFDILPGESEQGEANAWALKIAFDTYRRLKIITPGNERSWQSESSRSGSYNSDSSEDLKGIFDE